jgi:alpha-tubulin suppressor-like RCC1 family protein
VLQILPGLVPNLLDVKDAQVGDTHSVALTNAGDVYTWGSSVPLRAHSAQVLRLAQALRRGLHFEMSWGARFVLKVLLHQLTARSS